MAQDLREMTFQNVLDSILAPAGVKVGGFPQELFLDLNEEEKEKWNCGICFLVVNDCRLCDNRHKFCHTCVFAWSMTYGENSQKCPMCRCDQKEYLPDKETNRKLEDKRIRCLEDNCTFQSPLKIFLLHGHGKQKYSNVHVDFDRLKTSRPSILQLPGILLGVASQGRNERTVGIRSQLQQGRVMIHQMMMLLHLEMQLRQQALASYQEASDPVLRLRRLDEVLALNEQLNEVGGILSALLNTPLQGMVSTGANNAASGGSDIGEALIRASPSRGGLSTTIRHSPTRIMGARGLMNPLSAETDDEDDDDDETSSDSSGDDVTSARRHLMPPRASPNPTPRLRAPLLNTSSSPSPSPSLSGAQSRSIRSSEVRSELLSSGNNDAATYTGSSEPTILQQRVLLSRRQTQNQGAPSRQQASTTTTQRLGSRGSVTDVIASETSEASSQASRSTTLPGIPTSPSLINPGASTAGIEGDSDVTRLDVRSRGSRSHNAMNQDGSREIVSGAQLMTSQVVSENTASRVLRQASRAAVSDAALRPASRTAAADAALRPASRTADAALRPASRAADAALRPAPRAAAAADVGVRPRVGAAGTSLDMGSFSISTSAARPNSVARRRVLDSQSRSHTPPPNHHAATMEVVASRTPNPSSSDPNANQPGVRHTDSGPARSTRRTSNSAAPGNSGRGLSTNTHTNGATSRSTNVSHRPTARRSSNIPNSTGPETRTPNQFTSRPRITVRRSTHLRTGNSQRNLSEESSSMASRVSNDSGNGDCTSETDRLPGSSGEQSPTRATRGTNPSDRARPSQTSGALPTTPGQLMRARRRSEIHQQFLYRDRSDQT